MTAHICLATRQSDSSWTPAFSTTGTRVVLDRLNQLIAPNLDREYLPTPWWDIMAVISLGYPILPYTHVTYAFNTQYIVPVVAQFGWESLCAVWAVGGPHALVALIRNMPSGPCNAERQEPDPVVAF